jgi:hypothetical protein
VPTWPGLTLIYARAGLVSELLGIESVYFGPKCLLTSTSTLGVNDRTRWRSDFGTPKRIDGVEGSLDSAPEALACEIGASFDHDRS